MDPIHTHIVTALSVENRVMEKAKPSISQQTLTIDSEEHLETYRAGNTSPYLH